jgi:hypothetical protein
MRTTGEKRHRKPARRPALANSEALAAVGVEVTPEERHRVAECCAFFEAEKYREAEPGRIRSADVEKAEAQIDAVIAACGKAERSGDA